MAITFASVQSDCASGSDQQCHLCEPPCRLLTTVASTSSQDCCRLCASTTNCRFWTQNYDESKCHLKQDQSDPTTGNCTSGVRLGPAAAVTIDPTIRLHPRQRGLHGCHIDLGYNHQAYGFTTELLYGESFESFNLPGPTPPPTVSKAIDPTVANIQGVSPGPNTTLYWYAVFGSDSQITTTTQHPFNGLQSLRMTRDSGMPPAGVTNRGFHGQGFSLAAGHRYQGSVYVRNPASAKMLINISLADFHFGRNLDSVAIQVAPSNGTWQKVKFTLTPAYGTTCQDYPWDTAPLYCYGGLKTRPGHACWQCGGQLTIQLDSYGVIDLDSASLEDIDVRFDHQRVNGTIVRLLQDLELDGIRLGGTYVKTDVALNDNSRIGYYWKALRGDPALRPPVVQRGSGISPFWGDQLRSAVFGPFEVLNLTERLNMTGIVTLNHLETADDLSDLVDYMFSDDDANEWVQKRKQDGWSEPFNMDKYFELGNEIFNFNFVDQVTAMEQRAAGINANGEIRYACPWECGTKILDQGAAKFGDQIYLDRHDQDDPQADTFNELIAQWQQKNYSARFSIWETNTGTLHDFQRVMQEAQDMNQYEREGKHIRLDSRTASFCVEASGHDDLWANKHGDQGLIFFAPNQTWPQPPYYVHKMIAQSKQDYVIASNASVSQLDVVAMSNDDGSNITVRVLNFNPVAIDYEIDLRSSHVNCRITSTRYAAPRGDLTATNPAVEPYRYVPVVSTSRYVAMADGWNTTAAPYEFATHIFTCDGGMV
eukprot:TRINITY_DN10647_c0_g3_i1.p1 TRINITY_DN10647_c0_g3~~TRINITY_DN10647_c0_g3_i1.p1  ORF type:complete len:783 (+),score=137.43 TRINITY_DN10647_c0_g3_i1:55-2349(+)